MSEKPKSIHDRQSRFHLLLLPVVITCSSLLTSCGGGSDSASTAESADGTKQALAVSGSSAVPPGWTGRAPKMEVINGITVPPEPTPAVNNATVAGVDVNNNGVRDDMERAIANKVPDKLQFASALKEASLLQKTLEKPTNRAAALSLTSQILCAGNVNTSGLSGRALADLLITTESRRLANREFVKNVGAHLSSELSSCE